MPRATGAGAATAHVVLLHGEERFLVDQKARSLVDTWAKDLVSDFGLEPIEGAGLQAARLLLDEEPLLAVEKHHPWRGRACTGGPGHVVDRSPRPR